jgi:hypothetical protein
VSPEDRPLLVRHLGSLAKATAKNIREALLPSHTRIDALEERMRVREARPLPKWAGTWEVAKAYPEGTLTTHKGALCGSRPTTRPPPRRRGDGLAGDREARRV